MTSTFKHRYLLVGIYILCAGCASAELKEMSVDAASNTSYQTLQLDVALTDHSERESLIQKLSKELRHYDLKLIKPSVNKTESDFTRSTSAILKIDEINRRLEPGTHHRRYGRTSLTQQRGRIKHEKPVINLRVILIDFDSNEIVFRADYEAAGPWYADSSTVVAALAKTVCEQLEDKSFIILQ